MPVDQPIPDLNAFSSPLTLSVSAVQAILRAAKTGKIGDGKIFVTTVDEAIRIRNEDRGEAAL